MKKNSGNRPRDQTWSVVFCCRKQRRERIIFNIRALTPIERKPDGSLPRMTPEQRQKAVKLIRKICCNYDSGNCLLLDCTCPQSISYSVNCKFFRRALLEDKEGQPLKAEIFRDDTTKRCLICGKAFQSKSNNAKYCGDCANEVQKRQKSVHARKRRSKVEK